jgi:hypothetical protein
MTMKILYFFIVSISLVTSVQGADKKKPRNRTPSIPIPGKHTPDSSSPSSASFSVDLLKSPKSWDTDNNSGNFTEDLNEMTSSTELEGHLRLPTPVVSPRGDKDEGLTQKKSRCTKLLCYFCCCYRKKKTSSEYAAIS